MRATLSKTQNFDAGKPDKGLSVRPAPAWDTPGWDEGVLRRRWLVTVGPAAPLLVPALFAVLLFGF